MRVRLRSVIGALVAVLLVSTLTVAPAQARNSAGNISLSITGHCAAPGDSIKRVSAWTPEKGHKQQTFARNKTSKHTINFGTFHKKVKGNTFFNWDVDCWLDGNKGGQKWYGGNAIQTNYKYTIKRLYSKTTGI